MQRRVFGREFKLEAVRLVKERAVSVVQASGDLNVAESVLRPWIRDAAADPQQAFPGHGQIRPEQQEIERLRREVAKLNVERAILKTLGAGRRPACDCLVSTYSPRAPGVAKRQFTLPILPKARPLGFPN